MAIRLRIKPGQLFVNLLGGFVQPLKFYGGFRGVNLITICTIWNLPGSGDGILKIINTKDSTCDSE